MSKKIPLAILVALVWLMTIPQSGAASDIDWRINMQGNGSLSEEVRIEGMDTLLRDPSWQLSREGAFNIWRRDVQNWSTYPSVRESMPLQVQQSNRIFWQQTMISIDPDAKLNPGTQLTDAESLRLTISAPGFIFSSTAEPREGLQQASWEFIDSSALLQADSLARVITINGLLLGIGIILLGFLWIGFKFVRHMSKANQIIAEEYALPTKKS